MTIHQTVELLEQRQVMDGTMPSLFPASTTESFTTTSSSDFGTTTTSASVIPDSSMMSSPTMDSTITGSSMTMGSTTTAPMGFTAPVSLLPPPPPVTLTTPITATGDLTVGWRYAIVVHQLHGEKNTPVGGGAAASVSGALAGITAPVTTVVASPSPLPLAPLPPLALAPGDMPTEADFDFSNVTDWQQQVFGDRRRFAAYAVRMIGGSFQTLTDPTTWDYEPSLRAWQTGLATWSPPGTAPGSASGVTTFFDNLVTAGLSPTRWHRWLYTGDPGAGDDVYGEALEAAGASYTDNAGLAHQALQQLGTLGNLVSSSFAMIEGAELHTQLMLQQRDRDRAELAGNGVANPGWETQLMKGVRDNASTVLMAVKYLSGPMDEAALNALSDTLIAQARQKAVKAVMDFAINTIRDSNDQRLEELADYIEDPIGEFNAAQHVELALEEAFLLNIENQVLAAFRANADLDTIANITTTLNGIQALLVAEAARLAALPPLLTGFVPLPPVAPIGMANQQAAINALLILIPQIKDAIPKLVFATDIIRFSREQLEAARIQAEAQAVLEEQMQNDSDTVDKDKLREIVLRRKIKLDEKNGTLINGKPQNTNSKVQADDVNPHAVAVNLKARELIESGDYEIVAMTLSWRTVTGRRAESSNKPDIIAIKKDGSTLGIEIRSP